MLLMPEQNKGHVVDVGTKQKPCPILFKLAFSKLLHGYLLSCKLNLSKLICSLSCYVDLSKFSMFFLPFSKKKKLKFDHDFKAC